jgi:hypothetical protein
MEHKPSMDWFRGHLPEKPIFLWDWFSGWPTPLKDDGVKVSWDDDIPFSSWKVMIHSCSSHHQPVIVDHINIPTYPNYGWFTSLKWWISWIFHSHVSLSYPNQPFFNSMGNSAGEIAGEFHRLDDLAIKKWCDQRAMLNDQGVFPNMFWVFLSHKYS